MRLAAAALPVLAENLGIQPETVHCGECAGELVVFERRLDLQIA